jgi:hypothetical protein
MLESAMANPDGEVTVLLAEMRLGHKDALDRLMPLVYAELRRLAGHYLRGERIGHTLQPTAWLTRPFCDWWAKTAPTGNIVGSSLE